MPRCIYWPNIDLVYNSDKTKWHAKNVLWKQELDRSYNRVSGYAQLRNFQMKEKANIQAQKKREEMKEKERLDNNKTYYIRV